MGIKITFWGVRGSIPCALPEYAEFGGNTACVEAEIDGHTVIFDAGTGIRPLSKVLKKRGLKACDLLISHTHWDHISGFPFFEPLFDKDFTLTVYGGVFDGRTVRAALTAEMEPPFFPISLNKTAATVRFRDIAEKGRFTLNDGKIAVSTVPLNHPNGATGYRIDAGGASFAYISDTEHPVGKDIVGMIRGCDMMIYDATYTSEEYAARVGWGHSTADEAAKLADEAGVKRVFLFHHSPDHTDADLNEIEQRIQRINPRVSVAREGESLTL